MRSELRLSTILLTVALATGCSSGKAGPQKAPKASPEDTAEAQQIFATRCTPCHGTEGKGDGPASASLTPRPRDFSDPAWQKEVTNEHIGRIIQYGGAAVGKSPAMPPNPDLGGKPGVVKALTAHVRGLDK